MFSNENRCLYRKNQLADVICQLRFPDILTINATPPAVFQDSIRDKFPQYAANLEASAPRITGTPGNFHLNNQQPTVNYQFTSADGIWRVNLTSRFISLACNQYTGWESFAQMLDAPLSEFIKIYKPAYFQRIGLRYINFISRNSLGLSGTHFRELFQSPYLGILCDETVDETCANSSCVDAQISIAGGCKAKIHAGPGIVKRKGQSDDEIKFIFDQDLFMAGNIPVNYSAGALETLHSQAYPIFRDAITEMLHEALEPISIK